MCVLCVCLYLCDLFFLSSSLLLEGVRWRVSMCMDAFQQDCLFSTSCSCCCCRCCCCCSLIKRMGFLRDPPLELVLKKGGILFTFVDATGDKTHLCYFQASLFVEHCCAQQGDCHPLRFQRNKGAFMPCR